MKALARFKQKAREITRRTRGISPQAMVKQLATYPRGWGSYYGFCQTPSVLHDLNSWLHRRIRCFQWKQWQRGTRRYAELRRRGVEHVPAAKTAGSAHGPWRLARGIAMSKAMPESSWEQLGLPRLSTR